jgi:hypothetical protein
MTSTLDSSSFTTEVLQKINHIFLLKLISKDEYSKLLSFVANYPSQVYHMKQCLELGDDRFGSEYLKTLLDYGIFHIVDFISSVFTNNIKYL